MEYLSVKEVAVLKGCSIQYVKRIAKEGKLEAVQELNPANNCMQYKIPVSALPDDIRAKYNKQKQQELGLQPELKEPLEQRSKTVKTPVQKKRLTDRGETMGVCFVGNPSFMRHFDDKKLPVTGQVFNRANLRPYIKASDIKIGDIKLLFPELSSEKNAAEIKFLYAVAQTNGEGIRRAINFYRSAYNMDGGNVTVDRLAELAQMGNLRIPSIGNLIKRLREESA